MPVKTGRPTSETPVDAVGGADFGRRARGGDAYVFCISFLRTSERMLTRMGGGGVVYKRIVARGSEAAPNDARVRRTRAMPCTISGSEDFRERMGGVPARFDSENGSSRDPSSDETSSSSGDGASGDSNTSPAPSPRAATGDIGASPTLPPLLGSANGQNSTEASCSHLSGGCPPGPPARRQQTPPPQTDHPQRPPQRCKTCPLR